MKKVYVWTGVVIIAALIIIGVTSSNNKAVNSTVRIGYLPVVQGLPVYLGIDKGYFKEAGIDVQLTKFDAPNQIIDALLSNNTDMAIGAATGITAIAESKKPGSLKIFAIQGGDSQHIADGLIVQKDSDIKTIQDLRGKKVGVLPGIQWKTIAQNLFDQNGLDINKDVTLVELAIPLQAQALAAKQVDALLTIEPVIAISNSKGISRDLMVSPNLQFISNPFYAGVGNVSTSFIKNNPELYKKVIKILDRATKEINADPELSRQYLVKNTALTADLAKTVNLTNYKMYSDMTETDKDAVQKFIDIFIKFKVIETPVKAVDIIYHD